MILGELSADDADAVAALLEQAHAWDGLAGHAVHIATTRRWPVLTADPGRPLRVTGHIEIDPL